MESEVYADLLFLVNFSMDFLCFYLCARLLRRPLSLWRGILASALGGVYAVAVLFLTVGKIPAFLLDFLVGYLLCMIALVGQREKLGSRLRLGGLYLLVSLLLGGIMTALFEQMNRVPGLLDRVSAEGFSTWLFFGLALLSTLLTLLWGRWFRRATLRRRVTLIITRAGARTELCGLMDTGNLLRDPISGKPVIPADARLLGEVVPPEILRAAGAGRVSEAIAKLPPGEQRGIRMIPARTAVGQGEKLLIGWQPERIFLKDERGEHEIEALIAPVSLNRGDGIEAVVPCELIP